MTELLQVSHLGKRFGGVQAVADVGFALRAGEVLALIGPNGAGKTTTFNMLSGQLKADTGSVQLKGAELVGKPPRDIWRLGVGRTFQIAETFKAKVIDYGKDSLLLEFVQTATKNDAVVKLIKEEFHRIEVVRGGSVGIESISMMER